MVGMAPPIHWRDRRQRPRLASVAARWEPQSVNAKRPDIRPASMLNDHWIDAISDDDDFFRSLEPLLFWLLPQRYSLG